MKYCVILLIICLGCSHPQVIEEIHIQDKASKDMLIEVAKRVYARGQVSGTGGDISVRVPGEKYFFIKATGMCIGDLKYDKFSKVGLDGKIFDGSPQPSHETNIHLALYNLYDNISAIMHIHSPYATAWATVGEKIPPVTQQSVNVLKGIGIVPYYPPGSKELLDEVMKCYENPETHVVMMENHGTFIVGTDLYDILYKGEVVENTAKIAYLSRNLGTPIQFEPQKSINYRSPDL